MPRQGLQDRHNPPNILKRNLEEGLGESVCVCVCACLRVRVSVFKLRSMPENFKLKVPTAKSKLFFAVGTGVANSVA